MEATHYLYYREFTTYLGQLMQPRQSIRAMAVRRPTRDLSAPGPNEHARIRDAIAGRDPEAAREAALDHLRNSHSRIGALRARLARSARPRADRCLPDSSGHHTTSPLQGGMALKIIDVSVRVFSTLRI